MLFFFRHTDRYGFAADLRFSAGRRQQPATPLRQLSAQSHAAAAPFHFSQPDISQRRYGHAEATIRQPAAFAADAAANFAAIKDSMPMTPQPAAPHGQMPPAAAIFFPLPSSHASPAAPRCLRAAAAPQLPASPLIRRRRACCFAVCAASDAMLPRDIMPTCAAFYAAARCLID